MPWSLMITIQTTLVYRKMPTKPETHPRLQVNPQQSPSGTQAVPPDIITLGTAVAAQSYDAPKNKSGYRVL